MRTDLLDPNLLLDSCVPGRTAYKDLTIWNRSEFELQWALMVTEVTSSAMPGTSSLEFFDLDSSEPLSSGTVNGCVPCPKTDADRRSALY